MSSKGRSSKNECLAPGGISAESSRCQYRRCNASLGWAGHCLREFCNFDIDTVEMIQGHTSAVSLLKVPIRSFTLSEISESMKKVSVKWVTCQNWGTLPLFTLPTLIALTTNIELYKNWATPPSPRELRTQPRGTGYRFGGGRVKQCPPRPAAAAAGWGLLQHWKCKNEVTQ